MSFLFSSLCFLLVCGLVNSFQLKAELSNAKRTSALPDRSTSRLRLKWGKQPHCRGFVLGSGWLLGCHCCKRQPPPQCAQRSMAEQHPRESLHHSAVARGQLSPPTEEECHYSKEKMVKLPVVTLPHFVA